MQASIKRQFTTVRRRRWTRLVAAAVVVVACFGGLASSASAGGPWTGNLSPKAGTLYPVQYNMGDIIGAQESPHQYGPICVGPGLYNGHIVWPYGLKCAPGGWDDFNFARYGEPRITAYPGVYNPNGYWISFGIFWS